MHLDDTHIHLAEIYSWETVCVQYEYQELTFRWGQTLKFAITVA